MMKSNNLKQTITSAFMVALTTAMVNAAGTGLTWNDALSSNDDVSKWVRTLIIAVMAIFVMAAIIMGSLAFKQLASDGNWKDFWSKIAGAVGMFVTPIAVYWAAKI
jgi:hypothetical protein